jgi:hypothetical protein
MQIQTQYLSSATSKINQVQKEFSLLLTILV